MLKFLIQSLFLLLVLITISVESKKKYGFEALSKFYGVNPIVSDIVRCFKQRLDQHRNGNNNNVGLKAHPYIGFTIPKVIKAQGYPVEDISVVTEDGYILHVFRIPFSNKSPLDPNRKKKAIYLNHGMTANGQEYLIQWADRNLAFLLADSGFDVFIGNARGTRYSRGHVNKTLMDDKRYWDFSWDEMGRFDIPAVIQMILNKTESERLYYLGHSMGTTEFFVTMSQRPEFNDKILTAFLFTPSAVLTHTDGFIRAISPFTKGAHKHYLETPYMFGNEEEKRFPGINSKNVLAQVCSPTTVECGACSNIYLAVRGYGGKQANYTELPYITSIFPDTTSTKCIYHYLQIISSNHFRQYDYGDKKENLKRYGEVAGGPLDYDLSRITAPSVLFYAKNDRLCTPEDVEKLSTKLGIGSVKKLFLVQDPAFNHADFATAIQAKELVYDHVVEYMSSGIYDQK